MKASYRSVLFVSMIAAVLASLAQTGMAQLNQPPDASSALVKQGQKLNSEGRQDEALKLYQQALEKNPNLYEAQLEFGIALDLKGEYGPAREHLTKAIETAPPDQKNRALRVMAFSYAFEGNVAEVERYEKQVFDALMAKSDFEAAAGVANELARIKLELGDFDGATQWYKSGYETAMRKPDLKDTDKALWDFRYDNAQARLAARRGLKDEAQNHVVSAKAAFGKAHNPDQAPFVPYMTGYVAYYGGDCKTALADLQKANQEDPFILVLQAQAYEKLGNPAKAKEYYQKVMANNGHGPTNAFARPIAKRKLAGN